METEKDCVMFYCKNCKNTAVVVESKTTTSSVLHTTHSMHEVPPHIAEQIEGKAVACRVCKKDYFVRKVEIEFVPMQVIPKLQKTKRRRAQ